jgi:hypothetical protein
MGEHEDAVRRHRREKSTQNTRWVVDVGHEVQDSDGKKRDRAGEVEQTRHRLKPARPRADRRG